MRAQVAPEVAALHAAMTSSSDSLSVAGSAPWRLVESGVLGVPIRRSGGQAETFIAGARSSGR